MTKQHPSPTAEISHSWPQNRSRSSPEHKNTPHHFGHQITHCVVNWHINVYLNHDSCVVTLNETNQPLLGFSTLQFVCFAPALLLCLFMQPAFCLQTSHWQIIIRSHLLPYKLVAAHPMKPNRADPQVTHI